MSDIIRGEEWRAVTSNDTPAQVGGSSDGEVLAQARADIQRYRTSPQLVSEALAYMQQSKASADDAARRFLKMHEALWTPWVPPEAAAGVKAKL